VATSEGAAISVAAAIRPAELPQSFHATVRPGESPGRAGAHLRQVIAAGTR